MEELNKAKQDYEKALEEGNVTRLNDILTFLGTVPITLALLKKTGIVSSLKKLKHSTNEDIKSNKSLQQKCSALISRWKKEVTEVISKESSEKVESSPASSPIPTENEKSEVIVSEKELSESEIKALLNDPSIDSVRSKFRNFLYTDFQKMTNEMNVSNSFVVNRVCELENALNTKYNKGNVITQDYRSHFRDIRFNLGKNRGLFCDVLFGEESCDNLVCMTAEEMLTDEKRKERERIQEEMFEAYQTDWDKHHLLNNFDTNFTCRRCGSHKIFTAQKQTRSADEPMTVFFECAVCGKRWREYECLLLKTHNQIHLFMSFSILFICCFIL